MGEARPMIDAQHLYKSFGALRVLADFSLTVARGETLVVIGPSGSGKTTLLRILCRLEKPDSGTVLVDGIPLSGKRQPQLHRAPPDDREEQHMMPAEKAQGARRLPPGAEWRGPRAGSGKR